MTQSLQLPIRGMSCSRCAERIEQGLNQLDGVTATVNFALEQLAVQLDKPATLQTVTDTVTRLGYQTEETTQRFSVEGMSCAACAARLEKVLTRAPGVVNAQVNFALAQAQVVSIGNLLTPAQLRELTTKAGFAAHFVDGEERARQEQERAEREQDAERRERVRLITAALLTSPLLLSMASMVGWLPWHMPAVIQWLLATPVQFWTGARFYRGAWRALRGGSANMDVLVVTGTSAAYFYSLWLWLTMGEHAAAHLYFEASAVVVTLVSLGKWLEGRAKRSTRAAIAELMALRPDQARVWRDERWQVVPMGDVLKGDRVQVLVGERLPVDGIIVNGASELDEAVITGESVPVVRQPGDKVMEGAINRTGILELDVLAMGADSSLGRIIHLVEQAQMGKAPFQQLVDRISALFVPLVMAIALITGLLWWQLQGNGEQALMAAVAVLVIACPCALGLATPAAVVTGTGAAARHGILIRDIDTLQKAHRIRAVIFDKTGTLTRGKPQMQTWQGSAEDLTLAAALQQGSEHPLAQAILAAVDVPLPAAEQVEVHIGRGISGAVAGHRIALGNARLMQEQGIRTSEMSEPTAGITRIWMAREGLLAGYADLVDPLRTESLPAVAALHQRHIATWLVSGDAPAAVEYAAQTLGLDGVFSRVLPEGKVEKVHELKSQTNGLVAMVGDGVNDAPALAAADVGIAMGSGADVALETAAITLMRPDPRLVVDAIAISAATWRTIRQNLFWAFVFNCLGIPLAAFGLLSPALAGAAMAMSSITVLTNSLLLKRWQPICARSEEK
ncbi:Cu+-exporting ATPase [Aeromonas sp. RU39B]|uniref:heavy metal translocating P-type ATPase n=1 Tax=Aeromonas sp. RU39B TaxID=1907416 RepID=UPI0009554423|nr:heavy metal translocating P-type ATPase [Aeromonas sp. RU39B]SIR20076.1 Cu+-exporting ATPase [Aeromonas sp. RU39B]